MLSERVRKHSMQQLNKFRDAWDPNKSPTLREKGNDNEPVVSSPAQPNTSDDKVNNDLLKEDDEFLDKILQDKFEADNKAVDGIEDGILQFSKPEYKKETIEINSSSPASTHSRPTMNPVLLADGAPSKEKLKNTTNNSDLKNGPKELEEFKKALEESKIALAEASKAKTKLETQFEEQASELKALRKEKTTLQDTIDSQDAAVKTLGNEMKQEVKETVQEVQPLIDRARDYDLICARFINRDLIREEHHEDDQEKKITKEEQERPSNFKDPSPKALGVELVRIQSELAREIERNNQLEAQLIEAQQTRASSVNMQRRRSSLKALEVQQGVNHLQQEMDSIKTRLKTVTDLLNKREEQLVEAEEALKAAQKVIDCLSETKKKDTVLEQQHGGQYDVNGNTGQTKTDQLIVVMKGSIEYLQQMVDKQAQHIKQLEEEVGKEEEAFNRGSDTVQN